jgi:hypothetical protein
MSLQKFQDISLWCGNYSDGEVSQVVPLFRFIDDLWHTNSRRGIAEREKVK